MEEKKKRGRPPLTEAEKQKRKLELNKTTNEWHKNNNYAAQKKYRGKNPLYTITANIPIENKPSLELLLAKTGLSVNQLFVKAVEEKYGVTLHKKDTDDV